MQDYDETNRGAIWKNDKKLSDRHPDFTGSLDVEGTDYWVSAWLRKPDANPKAPALSFSIKPKDEQQQKPVQDNAGQQFDESLDIPF